MQHYRVGDKLEPGTYQCANPLCHWHITIHKDGAFLLPCNRCNQGGRTVYVRITSNNKVLQVVKSSRSPRYWRSIYDEERTRSRS